MKVQRLLIMVLVTGFLAVGCAGPRIVHLISSNPKQVKMLYARKGGILGIGAERGIVKCEFKGDTLDNCRDVAIEFTEEDAAQE